MKTKDDIILETINEYDETDDETDDNYIDVYKNNNIVNDTQENKQNLSGGNKKNKMDIQIINNVKKMFIGEELTTLTEQDINLEDKKKIHITYNKKYKRYKRQQKI
jgi:hypothetical protein